ncbi:hypothetical protein [Microvirga massiliensis]|uniref:hypothetical protein n=1 Tax=Microvirga massiliensis TaxID=1033741 RepID=UPI0011C90470|nr:hypothetical protein [Microvirga massiliensis]
MSIPAIQSSTLLCLSPHTAGELLSANGQAHVLYVDSRVGSDHNDGSSWLTAKRTILAAYDALPDTGGFGGGGGTIVFAPGALVGGEVDHQGIWLIGASDPSFSSPPPGFRREKSVLFLGASGGQSIQFGQPCAAVIYPTQNGDQSHWVSDLPAIWLAGTPNRGTRFANTAIWEAPHAVRIGYEADGGGGMESMTALVWFDNLQILRKSGEDDGVMGPAVDIGWGFWLYFHNTVISSNENIPLESPRRACIRLRGQQSGLVDIANSVWARGGLYIDGSGSNVTVRNLIMEGDFISDQPPLVWVKRYDGLRGGPTIQNSSRVDIPRSAFADIQIEPPHAAPDTVVISPGRNHPIRGRAVVVNGADARQGQVGFNLRGEVVGRSFGMARASAPALNPSPLPAVGARRALRADRGMVVSLVDAPDGTLRAYNISDNGSRNAQLLLEPPSRPRDGWSVGDHVAFGCWLRTRGTWEIPSFVGFRICSWRRNLNIWRNIENGDETNYAQAGIGVPAFPAWAWMTLGLTLITAGSANEDPAYGACVYPQSEDGCTFDIFEPILLTIPAGSMTDDEFGSWYYNSFLPLDPRTPAGAVGTSSAPYAINGRLFAKGLPTSDPHIAGEVWNDRGTLKISSGP